MLVARVVVLERVLPSSLGQSRCRTCTTAPDRETIAWFVMQDHQDKRAFTIVERFEHESSQKYHLENPYWKTFNPYVEPLLEKPMDIRRFNELESTT